ncbi:PLPL1 protein, partial [Brachypteracias leptosomus]|nr:PLPL1 protein [Brachypteracias leptosomus]
PYSILFRGCGLLLTYQTGVAVALQDLSPDILKCASKIYGASSGSIIATLLLCECDLGKGCTIPPLLGAVGKGCTIPPLLGNALETLKETLNKYLPPNAHQMVSGRLHIIITRLRDCRSVAISEFTSKEDIIQAVICSCFVPPFVGLLPPVYRGMRYVDGEIGMWRSNFVSRTTITISGFAGEYDICPKDVSAAFFTMKISDWILHISKRNIFRLMCIL